MKGHFNNLKVMEEVIFILKMAKRKHRSALYHFNIHPQVKQYYQYGSMFKRKKICALISTSFTCITPLKEFSSLAKQIGNQERNFYL